MDTNRGHNQIAGRDWYDVTDFVHLHPAGTLILEYLGRDAMRCDATDILLSFHLDTSSSSRLLCRQTSWGNRGTEAAEGEL
jgi:hypothetical protein